MGFVIIDKFSNDVISKEGGIIKKNDLDINYLVYLICVFLREKDMWIFCMFNEKRVIYW